MHVGEKKINKKGCSLCVISYKATMAKEKDYLRTGQADFFTITLHDETTN